MKCLLLNVAILSVWATIVHPQILDIAIQSARIVSIVWQFYVQWRRRHVDVLVVSFVTLVSLLFLLLSSMIFVHQVRYLCSYSASPRSIVKQTDFHFIACDIRYVHTMILHQNERIARHSGMEGVKHVLCPIILRKRPKASVQNKQGTSCIFVIEIKRQRGRYREARWENDATSSFQCINCLHYEWVLYVVLNVSHFPRAICYRH